MNDTIVFVIKTVISLFNVNLPIIIYYIHDNQMILFDDLIVIFVNLGDKNKKNNISLFWESEHLRSVNNSNKSLKK